MIRALTDLGRDTALFLVIDEGVPSCLEPAPLDESVVCTRFPPAERIGF